MFSRVTLFSRLATLINIYRHRHLFRLILLIPIFILIYCMFKHEFNTESYFDNIIVSKYRIILTKFRASAHK